MTTFREEAEAFIFTAAYDDIEENVEELAAKVGRIVDQTTKQIFGYIAVGLASIIGSTFNQTRKNNRFTGMVKVPLDPVVQGGVAQWKQLSALYMLRRRKQITPGFFSYKGRLLQFMQKADAEKILGSSVVLWEPKLKTGFRQTANNRYQRGKAVGSKSKPSGRLVKKSEALAGWTITAVPMTDRAGYNPRTGSSLYDLAKKGTTPAGYGQLEKLIFFDRKQKNGIFFKLVGRTTKAGSRGPFHRPLVAPYLVWYFDVLLPRRIRNAIDAGELSL